MFKTNTKIILFLVLMAFAIPAIQVAHSQNVHSENSAGQFDITLADGSQKSALLLSTHISGDVNAMMASIKVRQNFKNDSDQWVNGRYVFPLPEGAAVDSLKIEIGERVINGVIKEKAQAKKIFEQAKKAGKKAGLLEQHRPNLFSIAVANIAPHEELIASITFIDKVSYEDDTFSLRLPTTLTPRYIPGAPINSIHRAQLELELQQQFEESAHDQTIDGSGWAANTDVVSDASAITPPQAHIANSQTANLFSLALSINAGLDLHAVTSNTHKITAHFMGTKEVDVDLANSVELMDKDLVISWQPSIGTAPQAALFQQKMGNDYYSLLMVVPPSAASSISLPRDVTFIIDSSGSMAGESMRQAKQSLHEALNYLTPNDHFNIIDFDSSYRPLFNQNQLVTPQNIKSAKRLIDGLKADGGTEMMGALAFALNQPVNRGEQTSLRQIIFITDGAIGNETQLFKLIAERLGDARLFTVGIGSAPNAYFMRKAAKFGQGTYTYISDLQRVSSSMQALFKKIHHPVMQNLKVNWHQPEIEQYPAKLPDLYAGEPLSLIVKSKKPIKKASINGEMLNTPWQQKITRAKQENTQSDNLDTLWARQKVASLMDKRISKEMSPEETKRQIIELGIAHHIVTKFTSFVAIEQRSSKPQEAKAKHHNVPNLMPKGSTMPMPQTATPATLYTALGSLFILIGSALRRRKLKLSTRGES